MSLTPSPVMATTWPRELQRLDQLALLFREDPAEHGGVLDDVGERTVSTDAHVDEAFGPGSSSRRATAETVWGLSPEITLTVTC